MTCPSCQHERLLHDSWGCKTKCGCGVSIIYLTSIHITAKEDQAEQTHLIGQGNMLDREEDEKQESYLKQLHERARAESLQS